MTTQTQTTHTPGPWHVNEVQSEPGRTRDYFVHSKIDLGEGDYTDKLVARVLTTPEDAHLLASAPDLLDALKETREELRSLMVRAERRSLADWARTLLSERMHTIDAAMAKAEGVA